MFIAFRFVEIALLNELKAKQNRGSFSYLNDLFIYSYNSKTNNK
jgi:hypothetical protein